MTDSASHGEWAAYGEWIAYGTYYAHAREPWEWHRDIGLVVVRDPGPVHCRGNATTPEEASALAAATLLARDVARDARAELEERARERLRAATGIPDRARRYALRMDRSITGQRGHAAAYRVAVVLVRGFALDVETALAIMAEWNLSCDPPWPERELRRKIRDAARSSRTELGAYISR